MILASNIDPRRALEMIGIPVTDLSQLCYYEVYRWVDNQLCEGKYEGEKRKALSGMKSRLTVILDLFHKYDSERKDQGYANAETMSELEFYIDELEDYMDKVPSE